MKTATSVSLCLIICYVQLRDSVVDGIVGGIKASEETFPFTAAIFNLMGWFHCSASIIDVRWILTAGHCLSNMRTPRAIIVKVGVIVTHTKGGINCTVQELYVHPKFKGTKNITWYDIGLILLEESLQLSPTIQTIPLGGLKSEEEVFVLAMGYGQEYSTDSRRDRKLNYLMLQTIPFRICREWHIPLLNIIDKPTQLCAWRGINMTLCRGDSGGPLIDPTTGKQVGVYSSMEDCTGRYPVLYAKVSYFLPWIEKVTLLKFR